MYYTILGSIVFANDENWKPEALVYSQALTTVSLDYDTASELGESLMLIVPEADSYLIPQAFNGRIYNNTDKLLLIAEGVTIPPNGRIEWREDSDER